MLIYGGIAAAVLLVLCVYCQANRKRQFPMPSPAWGGGMPPQGFPPGPGPGPGMGPPRPGPGPGFRPGIGMRPPEPRPPQPCGPYGSLGPPPRIPAMPAPDMYGQFSGTYGQPSGMYGQRPGFVAPMRPPAMRPPMAIRPPPIVQPRPIMQPPPIIRPPQTIDSIYNPVVAPVTVGFGTLTTLCAPRPQVNESAASALGSIYGAPATYASAPAAGPTYVVGPPVPAVAPPSIYESIYDAPSHIYEDLGAYSSTGPSVLPGMIRRTHF